MVKTTAKTVAYLLAFLVTTGCEQNESFYYADAQKPGVSIFSNTGNNVFSCIVDGLPWQTIARTTGGFFIPAKNEVYITRQRNDTLPDLLTIQWTGYFSGNRGNTGNIKLTIPVAKNFRFADMSAWQGKRLTIDGTSSYFFAEIGSNYQRGNGTIYFNIAKFDSTLANGYHGKMSGLMEADFSTFKISSGRFDHNITPGQVSFY